MTPTLRKILLGSTAPSWVLRSNGLPASLDLDFVNARAYANKRLVSLESLLTCTRASTGYYTNAAGVLSSVATNTLRYGDLGLLVEEARIGVVLWNRDLTNAAWTASNITAAKDQTGPDGVANSASSITATAGNATILQAITIASSARFQTAYVKRITGAGTVEMTMDNGSTWTAVTVTASWTRVSIPTQTLANPTVGFRIVTSGDAIAVDFVQNENGTFATSPIAVTSSSATRAADNIAFASNSWLSTSAGTFYAHYRTPPVNPSAAPNRMQLFQVIDSGNNRLTIRAADSSAANHPVFVVGDGTANTTQPASAATAADTLYEAAASYNVNASRGAALVVGGGTVATMVQGWTAPAISTLNLGCGGSSLAMNGLIRRFGYWSSTLSNAALQALTA